jgi:tetratricopeptide (TPR) repeat protein
MAKCYLSLLQHLKSAKCISQAIEMTPDKSEYLEFRMKIYLLMGFYELAQADEDSLNKLNKNTDI